ncbi:hypothetical protein [Devosia sp. A449]
MQEEHIVRDLEVLDGSRTIKATYFVETGTIHARIDGRTLMLSVGVDTPEDTVRRLVLGQIQTRHWRERVAERRRQQD